MGVRVAHEDAQRLGLTEQERARYLERCPDVLGPGSAWVVPVAFSGGLRELGWFFVRAGQRSVLRSTS